MKTEEMFKVKDESKCACINRTDKTVHMLEKGDIVEIIQCGDGTEKVTGVITDIDDKSIRLYTKAIPARIVHYDEITEVRTVTSSADITAVSGIIGKAANAYGIEEFLQKLLA